jgi:DNA-binding NtrC family response regulator
VRCSSGRFELRPHLLAFCARPVRLCRLPGPLSLPQDASGTLVLDDVGALSLDQQLSLFDWLGRWSSDLRVISVTAVPLRQLVEAGTFLEGLFHRLSAVQLDVTSKSRRK